MKKILLILTILALAAGTQAQEKPFQINRRALDVGVYDYSRVKKNSYKVYYCEEAEEKFAERLMSDERLKSVEAFGEYSQQDDGSTVFIREQWAIEYCPELEYVIITGGHGFISVYDLKTLEEILTNPTSHVYSPSGKYRFGTLRYEGIFYYIEVKEGEKYTPYLLFHEIEDAMSGVYWVDDETMYYLSERGNPDNRYWIGYSMTFSRIDPTGNE